MSLSCVHAMYSHHDLLLFCFLLLLSSLCRCELTTNGTTSNDFNLKLEPPKCGQNARTSLPPTYVYRIINGQAAQQPIPWMAYLRLSVGRHIYGCAGALVHPRFVLSAAHCFCHSYTRGRYGDTIESEKLFDCRQEQLGRKKFIHRVPGLIIYLGSVKIDSLLTTQYRGLRIEVHHLYQSSVLPKHNDLALIELSSSVPTDRPLSPSPICLPDADTPEYNVYVTSAGWGVKRLTDDDETCRTDNFGPVRFALCQNKPVCDTVKKHPGYDAWCNHVWEKYYSLVKNGTADILKVLRLDGSVKPCYHSDLGKSGWCRTRQTPSASGFGLGLGFGFGLKYDNDPNNWGFCLSSCLERSDNADVPEENPLHYVQLKTFPEDQTCYTNIPDMYNTSTEMCVGGRFSQPIVAFFKEDNAGLYLVNQSLPAEFNLWGLKDSCQGDSGGPVWFYDKKRKANFVIGLVSRGRGCGAIDDVGIVTRVSSFVTWIRDGIGGQVQHRSYRNDSLKDRIASGGDKRKLSRHLSLITIITFARNCVYLRQTYFSFE